MAIGNPAPKGNKYGEKFKTPELRLKVFNNLIKHLEQGLSQQCFEDCDWDTVEYYMGEYPLEFPIEKIESAVRKGMKVWESGGMSGTFGQMRGFNPISWIFCMKNKYGKYWKDKSELELEGGGEPVQIQIVNPYSDENKDSTRNAGGAGEPVPKGDGAGGDATPPPVSPVP